MVFIHIESNSGAWIRTPDTRIIIPSFYTQDNLMTVVILGHFSFVSRQYRPAPFTTIEYQSVAGNGLRGCFENTNLHLVVFSGVVPIGSVLRRAVLERE